MCAKPRHVQTHLEDSLIRNTANPRKPRIGPEYQVSVSRTSKKEPLIGILCVSFKALPDTTAIAKYVTARFSYLHAYK